MSLPVTAKLNIVQAPYKNIHMRGACVYWRWCGGGGCFASAFTEYVRHVTRTLLLQTNGLSHFAQA
jgi:hypothetical protein